jgi:hypothetical protein
MFSFLNQEVGNYGTGHDDNSYRCQVCRHRPPGEAARLEGFKCRVSGNRNIETGTFNETTPEWHGFLMIIPPALAVGSRATANYRISNFEVWNRFAPSFLFELTKHGR